MKEEAAEKKVAEKARKAALIQIEKKFKLERQGFFFFLYFVLFLKNLRSHFTPFLLINHSLLFKGRAI